MRRSTIRVPAVTLILGSAGSIIGVGTAMTIAGVLLTLAAVLEFARAPQLRAVP